MKKSVLFILFLSTSFLAANSTLTTYEEVMQEHINQLSQANTISEFQQVANGFVRISKMHEDEWLPPYYAAFAYANIGYMSEGKTAEKDAFFDEAEKHLNKAMERYLTDKNAELLTLKGFILMGKLNASPASRGQSLSPRIMQIFSQAVQMDEENPRALILLARMKLGMAQFMGQRTAEACGIVEKARNLFIQETESLTPDILLPTWGNNFVQQMDSICQ